MYDFNKSIDIVYFDAFSPNVQPELWSKNILSKIYCCMDNDGIFVTYSANGKLKRNLKEIGFSVEHLQGPKGKRVITRAIK